MPKKRFSAEQIVTLLRQIEVAVAHAALQCEGAKLLIAKFDQTWGKRVTRSRDIVEVVQRLPSSN